MNSELTWEQERDIAEYEMWLAEQAWESHLQRMIEQDQLAYEQEPYIDEDGYDEVELVSAPYHKAHS